MGIDSIPYVGYTIYGVGDLIKRIFSSTENVGVSGLNILIIYNKIQFCFSCLKSSVETFSYQAHNLRDILLVSLPPTLPTPQVEIWSTPLKRKNGLSSGINILNSYTLILMLTSDKLFPSGFLGVPTLCGVTVHVTRAAPAVPLLLLELGCPISIEDIIDIVYDLLIVR